ncbi:hypothetical protein [Methylobacterium sp. ID0610]|uniref:hypothetical protein n=1 Tax=Methylobacterium carpenticola TaxID=3344827 RepID=UPI00368661E3
MTLLRHPHMPDLRQLRPAREPLRFGQAATRCRAKGIMASIKVKVCGNGTYTVCCNGDVVSTGLTREQADQLASVLRSIQSAA